MTELRRKLTWALCLLCLLSAPLAADDEVEGPVQLSGAAHGALLDMEEGWGAGLNLELRAVWHPRPEFGLGLRFGCMLPLRAGDDSRQSQAAFRLLPGLWLRFGSAEAWGFVHLGLGWDAHLRDGDLGQALLAGALAGYAVAPSDLPFFFGFEISGELSLVGDELRALGLGAFVGWRI